MNHYAILTVLLAVLSAASCKNPSGNTPESAVPLKSGVLTEFMDTTVAPGDNFMAYVNGTWIRQTEIPADKPMYGVAYKVYEESEEDVKRIIEEAASGEFAFGSDEQKVGDLFQSYMDMEKRNALGIAPLAETFSRIDALQNHEDLAGYLAYANSLGYDVPLSHSVYQDFKNPTVYAVFFEQSGLGLPDREYYLKQDLHSQEIRTLYKAHIATMFGLAGLGSNEDAASTVLALETALAEKHLEKEKTRDLVSLYHMFPADTLTTLMPHFHWKAYLKEAGLEKQEQLGVLMLDYLKALDTIVHSTGMEQWKTYLKWSVINANDTRLTESLDRQNFEFYGKQLYGTAEQRPLWRRGVSVVNNTLGEVVGKVYVKKHFPPEAKARMEGLVDNLLKAYGVSIGSLDWMSEATRKQALDKLSKFRAKIGYPDRWKSYEVEIRADDLYGNLKRAALMEYRRELDKLGKPVDRDAWELNPQTVNAYYNPSLNEIVFPAAILQPPFFDLHADDAVNYGAIGAIIGHEIGHGFDDEGSRFDGDGVMRNWWADKDQEAFEERTQRLVEQYDQFEVLPDLPLNGEFTQGENIGDLGGLGIALMAYKMSLKGNEAPVLDGFTGEQRVFIGYAQAFQGKFRDAFLRVLVASDPHAPNEFRVNGVVRNLPEFYTAFNVSESDSLYLPPEERVKIW